MADNRFDAIVVGAGFAGAVAARDLRKAGRSVLILEARDRIGGRTWTRPFPGTEVDVELGGTYIIPGAQASMRAELERYGIPAELNPDPEKYVWDLDGELISGFPIPMEEMLGFESAMFEVIRNSRRLEFGKPLTEDLADLDTPFLEFLERAGAGPKTLALIGAFGDLGAGSPAESLSLLPVICEVAGLGNSVFSVFAAAAYKIEGGTKRLIEAIMADADAELRLSTPVRAINRDEEGVSVVTEEGETYTAAAAIVAIPMNCWGDVEFTPSLSAPKRAMVLENHLGRVRKVLALVEGVPDTFGLGRHPESITALLPAVPLPNGTLYAGFALDTDHDLTDPEVVQDLIQRYVPGARVLAVDTHDWNVDPYSKGAQCAYRAGRALGMIDVVGEGEGRISFATTDVSTGWLGWIDGAMESGAVAAARAEGEISGSKTNSVTT